MEMWQQNALGYLFQVAVLGQPLFWMWLHGSSLQIPEVSRYAFYQAGVAVAVVVLLSGFQVEYYENQLLLQYIALVMLAVYLLNVRNSFKEALCLGFLVVFLNSYLWELPLHMAELLSGVPHVGMVVQLWRLVPAPWLLSRFRFRPNARAVLSLGLGVSGLVMVARFLLDLALNWRLVYAANRLVCLLLLVKVVVEAQSCEGLE